MMTIEHAWLWRRLDRAGHDGGCLGATPGGWRVCGTALFIDDDRPCQLGYSLNADAGWQLRAAHVFGTLGRDLIDLHIAAGGGRPWQVNGVTQSGTASCTDLDLDFTPTSTFMLLRRLALAPGAAAACNTARLSVASGRLTRADRHLRRIGANDFVDRSARRADGALLRVDEHLAVLHDPGCWAQEAAPGRALSAVTVRHADADEAPRAARAA
jgi:uncharacterized protein